MINLSAFNSGSFSLPVVISGRRIVAFLGEDNNFPFQSFITASGPVSGHPAFVNLIDSWEAFPIAGVFGQDVVTSALEPSSRVFPVSTAGTALVASLRRIESGEVFPIATARLAAFLPMIDEGHAFPVSTTAFAILPRMIDAGVVFPPRVLLGRAMRLRELDSWETLPPTLTGRATSLQLVDSWQAFPILPRVEVRLAEIHDPFFFPSTAKAPSRISVRRLDGEIFAPRVVPETARIRTEMFDGLYVYPIHAILGELEPVRFKQAATPFGGEITRNNLAPAQDYYPITDRQQRLRLRYSRTMGLMDEYVLSNESPFGQVFYRAFYVRNDSDYLTRRNIDFWISGGMRQSLPDPIWENQFFVEDVEATHGPLANREEIMVGGQSRTSVFDQLRISYMVSEAQVIPNFNQDGYGVGVDLRAGRFMPGNYVTRIPILRPGEHVGIFLRVETHFPTDFPVKTDYSFFHLSYATDQGQNQLRESYPGVITVNSEPLGKLLPSIYMMVTTNHETLKRYLEEDVRHVYAKYPPYFLHHEDSP